MKRFNRTRLALLSAAGLIGGLGAIALVLGAVGVLAGPSPAALQAIGAIPVCTNCNIVVVSKDAGAANYTTVEEAMAYVAGQPHDAGNLWLVYIAPGTYDLAADAVDEPLQMLEYVDIQGAGEGVTTLTRGGGDTNPFGDISSATVVGADNAELRFLTVENTGGFAYATGILSIGAAPRLSHVTAIASGGAVSSFGVYNLNFSSPVMTDVTATASGGATSFGVINNTSSSPVMTDVTATASGSTGASTGVANFSSSSPTMTNVTATASGSGNSYGVNNLSSSSPMMSNVTATASGGGTFSAGVFNTNNSAPTIHRSRIEGSGSTSNYGIRNSSTPVTITIDASQIIGTTATISNTDAGYTVRVGDSLLDGDAVSDTGTFVCAASYNQDYEVLTTVCLDPTP